MDIHWHFVIEDTIDLPGNSTPQKNNLQTPPMKDDLVTFPDWPGIKFIVLYRDFRLLRDESMPALIHVHLARLRSPAG